MDYVRSILECLASICSCWHCTEDISNQGIEPSERTHLLADSDNQSPALRRSHSADLSNDSQSQPKKDDQNALSRLVQNTAINMINVGALDSHTLEHQEFTDRIKLYSQRLQEQWNNIQHPRVVLKGLLRDVPNHHAYLSKVINSDDTAQMRMFIHKAHTGVLGIQIDHKEAVVVPFHIP